MGLLKKNKEKKESKEKITPDMAGYRPEKGWWPDLTEYRKAMLLHNITFAELDTLLKEYGTISSGDKKQIVCDFFYTSIPDDNSWVYLEFPNFENVPHYLNLWHYQNLLIWLTEKTDKEFCLAIPKNQNCPLFLSTVDRKNPRGDSCAGIYADRDFYFEIPGNIFEWGPVPSSAFNYVAFLDGAFQFDTQWIPKVSRCGWSKTQVTLTVPE